MQGNPKESFADIMEKDLKGKDQGPQKEEVVTKDKSAPDSNKITKGPKQSRWDKQSSTVVLNPLEASYIRLVTLSCSMSIGRSIYRLLFFCLFVILLHIVE